MMILKHNDDLSKTLQGPNLTPVAAKNLAKHVVDTLNCYHADDKYNKSCDQVTIKAVKSLVNNVKLSCKKKVPPRYEEGNRDTNNFDRYLKKIIIEENILKL